MPLRRLAMNEKVAVQYCIPNWLRDEQIKVNTAKVKGRVEAVYDLHTEPIALVNYGPSLNDTWEQIKDFKFIMTCSGAHKFMVERGIIPTYHIDVDPRPHKVELIGQPQQGTQYMIASACHPALFDLLQGYDLKLWHIFDVDESGMRMLPHSEWAITGGCSVGVRTLTMARFIGFTDLHVFGMDGCHGASGKHAAAHPNQLATNYVLEYEGKEYKTTPAMLEAAKNTFHEMDMMKDTKVTFYGEGLVQEMAKRYQRTEVHGSTFIAFNKPELISAGYVELNRKLHADNLAYGIGGGHHAGAVEKLAARLVTPGHKFVSVLDYGCGKGYLGKALPFPIFEYDPAIPGKEESPRPADLVCCLDVLEHVEPDHLDFVLGDILRCTKQLAFFVIYKDVSKKTLADGRNSHLITQNKDWWRAKLDPFFMISDKGVMEDNLRLYVVAFPRPTSATKGGNKIKAL